MYAHWKPNTTTVNVTFNCNGGSGGGRQTFTYGLSGQKFSKTCTRLGYQQDGWNLPKNKNASSRDYTINSNVTDNWILTNSPSVTLYARWQPNTCTVTYNPNGGVFNSNSSDTKQVFNYNGSNLAIEQILTQYL